MQRKAMWTNKNSIVKSIRDNVKNKDSEIHEERKKKNKNGQTE